MQIAFGALAPTLVDQLAGSKVPVEKLEAFDRDADAVTRLVVRGLLTQSQANAARKKILKEIVAAAKN